MDGPTVAGVKTNQGLWSEPSGSAATFTAWVRRIAHSRGYDAAFPADLCLAALLGVWIGAVEAGNEQPLMTNMAASMTSLLI